MKTIKLPIHRHSPVRRRPSYHSVQIEYSHNGTPALFDFLMPVTANGNPDFPIVHTGTTKVKAANKSQVNLWRARNTVLVKMDISKIVNASGGSLIEVHKRPNIFKRIKKKVR